MGFLAHKFTAEKWKEFASTAHEAVFKEGLAKNCAEIDYALVIVDEENNTPCGYVTVKDMKNGICYWQHGGVFEGVKGTPKSFKVYQFAVNWAKDKYEKVFTMIENKNIAMLKFALSVGFIIIGMKLVSDKLILALCLDCKKGVENV